MLTFVSHAARDLLGVEPDVLPVSARLAQRAKQGDPSLWAASRFEVVRAVSARHARRAEPVPAEAGEPARRRVWRSRTASRRLSASAWC